MAAAPVLRAVTRLRKEVTRLPRIVLTPSRRESGGQGAAPSGVSKTLVPFPAKRSDLREAAAGEISAEAAALLPEPDESVRQESSVDPESADREPPQQDDSSSSSSSDSDSDEEPGARTPPPGKDPAERKSGSGDQNVLKEEQAAPERERRESRPEQGTGERGADLPLASHQLLHSPARAEPGGGRALTGGETGEDLEEGAPQMTPRGGRALAGEDVEREDLVDVPPEVTPGGGRAVGGEDLVDVAAEMTPGGGRALAGGDGEREDLVDVAAEVTPGGGRALAGGDGEREELVDVPPQMTPGGGRAVGGEDLVDVAAEVTPGGGRAVGGEELLDVAAEVTPGGGRAVGGEDLVDMAAEVTPGGGRAVGGEDLVDVAPGAEEPPLKSVVTAVGGDLAGEEKDPGELAVSSEEPRSSGSPDHSACEEIPEGEEAAASLTPPPPAAPAPAEPFDNSRYQNEQHFGYTPFTFVDYDLELARFRLPQPSSGRPSHRH